MTETLNMLTTMAQTRDDAMALADYARVMLMVARLRNDVSESDILHECAADSVETVCARGSR